MRDFLGRNWFPFALIAVFVLALPGLVLAVMNLFGAGGAANAWLEENLALTFHPALPPPLLIVILLLPLALLILYFLKLKRSPLQVPSTYLWKKSIEDLHVNSLLQWLRRNILLLLQLLILLALIYAVMGIRFHAGTTRGQFYILLLDNSASMGAKDLGTTRLDWAKEEALKVIAGKGDDDFGMVITFNSSANLVTGYTRDKAKLRDAVRGVRLTQRKSRIDEALLLAESQANQIRSIENFASQPEKVPADQERTMVQAKGFQAEVHLFSDGRFSPISESLLSRLNAREAGATNPLGNLSLRYYPAGKANAKDVNNLAVVALDAVRQVETGKRDRVGPQKLEVLARVRNYRSTRVNPADKVMFKLDLAVDGELVRPMQRLLDIDARTLTRNEGETETRDDPGEMTLTFTLPPVDARKNVILHAYLDGHRDDFALDDQAWFVVGSIRPARVVLVGAKNPVLEAFFEQDGIAPLAEVTKLAPEDLDTPKYLELARDNKVDLFLFDRCTPRNEEAMPLANTVFIDRAPPPWLRSTKILKNPAALLSDKKHPLLRYITTLGDVGFVEAFAFDLKTDLPDDIKAEFADRAEGKAKRSWPGVQLLLESAGDVPLVFVMNRGPYHDLVLAFPLVNAAGDMATNWPLQPSFPLFWRNVLYNLGNVEDSIRGPTTEPGGTLVLRPETTVRTLKITNPDGETDALERDKQPYFSIKDTEKIGLYRLERNDGLTRAFSVNLLDGLESNLQPLSTIRIGAEAVAAEGERPTPREIWKWILLAGFSLLVLEWIIYNKRVAL